jgi:FkbM family methyltransferase
MILYRGGYERHVLDLLERLLPVGGAFLDVGANIGLHTIVGSRRVGPLGSVHAIEPEPHCRHRLLRHLELNRINNVQVFAVAFSDHTGTSRLFRSPPENSAKSSFAESNTTMGLLGKSPGFVDVETQTLDEHVRHWGGNPDVVKIDVEGAELLVLRGGKETLSGDDAPAVLFEASDLQAAPFGYDTRALKSTLVSYGFQIFRYGERALEAVDPEERHRLQDLIALKDGHIATLGLLSTVRRAPRSARTS